MIYQIYGHVTRISNSGDNDGEKGSMMIVFEIMYMCRIVETGLYIYSCFVNGVLVGVH